MELLRSKAPHTNETSRREPNEIEHEGIDELSGSRSTTPSTFRQHVDLFSETIATTTRHSNEEYEKEKRQEQQKHDRQTTIYLVNDSKESDGQKRTAAWYETSHLTRLSSRQEHDGISSNPLIIDEQEKQREDPLTVVKQHFKKLESLDTTTSSSQQPNSHSTPLLSSTSETTSSRSNNKHQHTQQQSTHSSSTSIEHLREQRLRREKEERHRLARMYGNSTTSGNDSNRTSLPSSIRESLNSSSSIDRINDDDRKRPYHSQFHPELAATRHSPDQSYRPSKTHRRLHSTIHRPP